MMGNPDHNFHLTVIGAMERPSEILLTIDGVDYVVGRWEIERHPATMATFLRADITPRPA
jgi:hypothetical protein